MYIYNSFTFGLKLIQDDDFSKHRTDCNSENFTDLELKFGVVATVSHSQYILW